MPILNCAFSSARHIYGILSVGVPFLGLQHVRPEVILLLPYQSFPIQQSNSSSNVGLIICCLVFIKVICCAHIRVIIGWKWIGGSAAMLVLWHVLLYPFFTVVDSFIYIFAWADCPCCHTIVHFHLVDLASQVDVWVPY